MAMPQCCYLAKGAKRPSHTTNTIKFDRIPFDPCNSIKRFDLCPFDQKNSTYLQPPDTLQAAEPPCSVSNGPVKINLTTSVCNVRQSALQKFLKISIKNSKCATSNKHIQDGRPGRYENRRGSKIKAKHAQKDPTHHPGTRMSEMSSPRRRENQEFGHLTAKRQGFGRKVPNETIVPRR